jgi:hypothetical protein
MHEYLFIFILCVRIIHAKLDQDGANSFGCQSPVPSFRREAVQRVNDGEKVILVRSKTSADDIHGLHAAEGHLFFGECSVFGQP